MDNLLHLQNHFPRYQGELNLMQNYLYLIGGNIFISDIKVYKTNLGHGLSPNDKGNVIRLDVNLYA